MLFHVDPSSGVPIFRQLMDQTKLSIATGVLKPGDELPSIRNLSVPLGVNPMTISKAYNHLVIEGVLERRPGLPMIVAAIEGNDLTEKRAEQLRKSLVEAGNLVRAIQFDKEEALKIFEDLLNELLEDNPANLEEN